MRGRDIPIIFSAPMVRALLTGRKTMTRRLARTERVIPGPGSLGGDSDRIERPSPWQKVKAGDRLWVRENFARNANQLSETVMDTSVVYAADGIGRALDNGTEKPWTPCIHMPRRESRLTLVVTGSKVERLQDISKADVMSEGIHERDGAPLIDVHAGWHEPFAKLWTGLNGPDSWDENPFVVAISFDVIRANIDADPLPSSQEQAS